MGPEIVNRLKNNEIHGDFVGRDKITNIIMLEDSERGFVVTHSADIKPVSYFTGREAELKELRQRIEEGRKSVLVSGMGGIGKTHICRKLFEEYSNRHAKDGDGPFRHIGYIEYDGDMGSSLQRCLKYKEQDSPEKNRKAVWRELEYLASGGKLLLFVDNVNKPMIEDDGLKRLKTIPGVIVLTSRQASFSDEFEPYPIGFLDMEQCKEIYEKIRFKGSGRKIRPEEEQDLKYVIKDLAGRHTITIEFLAHLAWTKHWPVKRLRKELEEKRFCLEFHKNGELVNIQKSFEVLYDLSELTEAEQNILEAFSVFPYIPLEAETCNEWLLADAGVSEDDDILIGLYRKGWLQFDVRQESYALHPVFACFIYERCNPELEKHFELIWECQDRLEILQSGSIVECQKIIPFAESIIEKIDMRKGIEQFIVSHSLASLLIKTAKFKKAKELVWELLALCKEVLGEDNPITAASCHNLAYLYEKNGKYKKAEELYKEALRIRMKTVGEKHEDIVSIYSNLADLYNRQGEFKKAEDICIKNLKICKEVMGEKNAAIAINYKNLARVYIYQGEYRKAEKLYMRNVQIYEHVYGEEHPDTVAAYNNLAEMYERKKEYNKAKELYEKSVQICEHAYGEEHLDTAAAYNNLAGMYEREKEYNRAKELYEKSVQIYEHAYGEEHPDTAVVYGNLAVVFYYQGKYEEAEELYEKSLRIKKRVLGENHVDTAIAYSNWAGMYVRQGEYEIALKYGFKAYKIFVFKLGLSHPDTQFMKQNIEYAYLKWNPEGNFEQWLEEQMKEQ